MKFIPVDPEEVPDLRESHRGRVSYPILKSFLETNMPIAQLDTTGIQQRPGTLVQSLGNYIRNHTLPIKIFTRGNKIYLLRLDLDRDGNPVEWDSSKQNNNGDDDSPATPINSAEVSRRFAKEKGQVTK